MRSESFLSKTARVSTLLVGVVFIFALEVANAQQSISNPLLRPPPLASSNASPEPIDDEVMDNSEPVDAGTGNAEPDAALARQAAVRLSQEQLQVQQQRLNSSVVPKPLTDILVGMNVVAHYRDAVVLRGIQGGSTATSTAAIGAGTASTGAGSNISSTGGSVFFV